MPGYRRYCPYTLHPTSNGRWSAPDLRTARALVAASGTRGERIVVWGIRDQLGVPPAVPRYVVGVLRSLGYSTRLRLLPWYRITERMRRGFQISVDGDWQADYPAPSSDIPQFFSCGGGYSNGFVCDRALWVPMVTVHEPDVVSARIRNYEYNPVWGFIADQVWLR